MIKSFKEMVRLINEKNIDKVCKIVYWVLHMQEKCTQFISINNPNLKTCIYVMWHENQFAVYGFENKQDIYIQISHSVDGEIVSYVANKMGFNTVRGSAYRKGSLSSTKAMFNKLKEGKSVAFMIDGPNGPRHKVKPGAAHLAKDTGVPIVPVSWYSADKTFIELPSWDKMKTPIGPCKIIHMYGKPIYITEENMENATEIIKSALEELDKKAHAEFIKAKQAKLWKKR